MSSFLKRFFQDTIEHNRKDSNPIINLPGMMDVAPLVGGITVPCRSRIACHVAVIICKNLFWDRRSPGTVNLVYSSSFSDKCPQPVVCAFFSGLLLWELRLSFALMSLVARTETIPFSASISAYGRLFFSVGSLFCSAKSLFFPSSLFTSCSSVLQRLR